MRLLDLFCGAGGSAVGYARAGFEVVGVDHRPQPNYPFQFIQEDALWFAMMMGRDAFRFDATHASPPCQRYMTGGTHRKDHPDLLGRVRRLLAKSSKPFVIENVPGAPMRPDLVLCGSMFGLGVRRHRWFEFSPAPRVQLAVTRPCDHSQPITGVYGNAHGNAGAWPGMLPSNRETWSQAMGIDWMTARELSQAIPPAYCEFVGRTLLAAMR